MLVQQVMLAQQVMPVVKVVQVTLEAPDSTVQVALVVQLVLADQLVTLAVRAATETKARTVITAPEDQVVSAVPVVVQEIQDLLDLTATRAKTVITA